MPLSGAIANLSRLVEQNHFQTFAARLLPEQMARSYVVDPLLTMTPWWQTLATGGKGSGRFKRAFEPFTHSIVCQRLRPLGSMKDPSDSTGQRGFVPRRLGACRRNPVLERSPRSTDRRRRSTA